MTLQKFLIALMIPLVVLCMGCGGESYKHLTHDEARAMLKSDPNIILLDVRTAEEYEKKHIVDAILIPIADLREGDFSKIPDKNATIIIYCWTGRRAQDSAEILIEHGYKNVYEMGGIVDWTGSVAGTDVK